MFVRERVKDVGDEKTAEAARSESTDEELGSIDGEAGESADEAVALVEELPDAKEQDGLADYVDIRYLTPKNSRFEGTAGGFLRLTLDDGTTYTRVGLYRTFPFTLGDRYVSVRDVDEKEIGMIEDPSDFPKDVATLLREELDRRYFTPEIRSIENIKEEFGYAYWEVQTDAGPRRFTVRDMQQNLILLTETRLLVIDVDGNRFEIPDYRELNLKGRKLIEDLI